MRFCLCFCLGFVWFLPRLGSAYRRRPRFWVDFCLAFFLVTVFFLPVLLLWFCLGYVCYCMGSSRFLPGFCFTFIWLLFIYCQLTIWVLPRFFLGSAWFSRVLHGFCLGFSWVLLSARFSLGSTLFLCDFCLPCLNFWLVSAGFRLASVWLAFQPILPFRCRIL